MRLPQVAMATACVLFHRFFYSKSFVRNKMEVVAMACVCLSCKIEEDPRRPRDVINVFSHIKQVRLGKPIKPVVLDADYVRLKSNVLGLERRVLKELGFCVHIKHPHKLIFMYLQLLGYENEQKFMQMSWNFINDSLRTDIFVRYQPETIATACIYLSARKLNIPLPKKPSWYSILNVEEDDIRDCCYRIICLYQKTKPNQEELEKICDNLKAALDKKKKQAREAADRLLTGSAVNSPSSQATSPARRDKQDAALADRDGDRSRSRSNERNKKKKKHKQREQRGNPSPDRDRRDKKDKKKRDRSWSRSPIRKERRGDRSRSRDGPYSRSHDRRDRHEHKSYQDKYKKGERIERDHYRR